MKNFKEATQKIPRIPSKSRTFGNGQEVFGIAAELNQRGLMLKPDPENVK